MARNRSRKRSRKRSSKPARKLSPFELLPMDVKLFIIESMHPDSRRSSCVTLSSTSKAWYELAITEVYRHLEIDGAAQRPQALHSACNAIIGNTRRAASVRSLQVINLKCCNIEDLHESYTDDGGRMRMREYFGHNLGMKYLHSGLAGPLTELPQLPVALILVYAVNLRSFSLGLSFNIEPEGPDLLLSIASGSHRAVYGPLRHLEDISIYRDVWTDRKDRGSLVRTSTDDFRAVTEVSNLRSFSCLNLNLSDPLHSQLRGTRFASGLQHLHLIFRSYTEWTYQYGQDIPKLLACFSRLRTLKVEASHVDWAWPPSHLELKQALLRSSETLEAVAISLPANDLDSETSSSSGEIPIHGDRLGSLVGLYNLRFVLVDPFEILSEDRNVKGNLPRSIEEIYFNANVGELTTDLATSLFGHDFPALRRLCLWEQVCLLPPAIAETPITWLQPYEEACERAVIDFGVPESREDELKMLRDCGISRTFLADATIRPWHHLQSQRRI